MSKRIEKLLRRTLIEDGRMAQTLYGFELAEHIDFWYQGLVADQDEFVFAVTENSGDTAMLLITKDKHVYANVLNIVSRSVG